jgi:hypothetical protein
MTKKFKQIKDITKLKFHERGEDCIITTGDTTYRYGKRYNVHTNNQTSGTTVIDLRGTWEPIPCILTRRGDEVVITHDGKEYSLKDVLNAEDNLLNL